MNSSEIYQIATHEWKKLEPAFAEKAPDSIGVYVIRIADGKSVGRFQKDSNIVYIGSGNIKNRLEDHLNFRSDFKDKGWLLALMAKYEKLEVGVFLCEDPTRVERDLLFQYLMAHLELPPANHQLPELSKEQRVSLLLKYLCPDRPPSTEEIQRLLGQGGASAPPKVEPPIEGL